MAWTFNPFTGSFDQKGSGGGGGSSYIDGEVQNFSALPETVGTPPVDSAYLVREAEGTWLLNRKPAGIYIRTANTGTRASDWTHASAFPDVFNDANLVVYSNGDSSKNVKFDVSAVTTGTTRTISAPDKNISLDDAGDSRTPTSHAASHATAGSDPVFDQDLDTTDDVAFNSVGFGGDFTIDSVGLNWAGQNIFEGETNTFYDQSGNLGFSVGTVCEFGKKIRLVNTANFTGAVELDADSVSASTTRSIAFPDASGTIALTGDIPDASSATPQALGSAAAGTSDDYSRADHVHGAPALNDLSNVSAAAPNDNDVLVYDNATSTWVAEAPAAGGVSAIGTSAADVLSVSGSDLVADDGGTIDSADPFIKWDDTAGKLVYANPLSRPSGAFYVGLAPTTTALGSGAINIQGSRSSASRVALATNSIAIGNSAWGLGNASIVIGDSAYASTEGTAIGANTNGNERGVAIGYSANAGGDRGVAIGRSAASGSYRVAIGNSITANFRSEFATYAYSSCYWGGTTTDATPTILNLDATATNRFTIAANTALAVDVLLVARRSDTADKWLVARRFLGIRRDGSNNTSLIGSVQTLGTDQSDGSPTWSFALTADDTNEALQLEVTGAASETVQWRATAFYRVV